MGKNAIKMAFFGKNQKAGKYPAFNNLMIRKFDDLEMKMLQSDKR